MNRSNDLYHISSEDIDQLMIAFYSEIRRHDILGPIFIRAVGNDGPLWRAHEAKIASFWKSALQIERGGFNGNPMYAHASNPEIETEHFEPWLRLFRETAISVLGAKKGKLIADLADRIGVSLSRGLEMVRTKKNIF